MNIKYLILLLPISFLIGCFKPMMGPVSVGSNTYQVEGIKIFTCLSGSSPNMDRKLHKLGVKRSVLVNGSAYEDKDAYNIKKSKLKDYINKVVPNRNSTAFIVLDYEGKMMITLSKTKDNKVRRKILDYYIRVYRFVKRMRPQATIGFYGYPWRDYWNRNKKWKSSNDLLLPLFKEVDALFPSVYDFYVDGRDVSSLSDQNYVKDNIEESLRLAAVYGKPVYPFVWHRYHDSNKKSRHQFINPDEFRNHIAAIASTSYKGTRVKGIVWWSSEQYFYNISKRGKRTVTVDFDRYFDESSLNYIDILINGIKQGKDEVRNK